MLEVKLIRTENYHYQRIKKAKETLKPVLEIDEQQIRKDSEV
jgi:hypothetical protein